VGGEYRSVNMSKGSAPGGFADRSQIGRYLADANRVIVATDWRSLDREGFAAAAATAFAYVNQAHPFREGNGRAAKVFMEQVAEQSSFTLDYARVAPQRWNESSMFSAPDLGSYEPVPGSLVPVFRDLAVEATAATAPHRATWPGAGAGPGQLAGAAQIPDGSGPQGIAKVAEPLTTSAAQAARRAAGLSFPTSPREALRGGGSARVRVDRGGVRRGRGGELER
jgi:cell filamentation protein